MAIHVFMAVLEYYLFAALVGIFLPFGVLGPTKFLAEKAVGAVVSASVKLMVLAFLLAVVDPVLSQIHFQSAEITFNELWSVFLTVCALMLLCWKGPSLAAALLGGSPHLGAGDVLQAVSTPIAASMAIGALGARFAGGAAARAAASGGPAASAGGSRASAASSLAGGGASPGAPGPAGSPGNQGPSGPGGKDGGAGAAAGSSTSAPTGAGASLVQSVMGKAVSTASQGRGDAGATRHAPTTSPEAAGGTIPS
jgi:type IV secretion system protein TrbL